MTTHATTRRAGASPDQEAQVLDTIDRWVEKEVRPIARKFDQADEYPVDLVEQMKELGLFGATIGQEWGGLGLSASTDAGIVARISQAWMAPTGIFNSHLIMAACVERNGTEEQKRRYLPRFATGELRGGIEGRGFHHAVGGLELGRINVAARGVGLATGAFKDALAYAQQRRTFGKPIAQHQAIQLKLADMATRVEAARLLVEQAAREYDTGERCDLEAGMAKLFASETAVENSLEAMRIFGGYSYSVDFDVERYYRDSPLMCIGEGTNEMQRIIIARQLVERNPV